MSDYYILKNKNDEIMRFKLFSDEVVITDEIEFPIFVSQDIKNVSNVAKKNGYGDFAEPLNRFDDLIITKCVINVTAEYPNLS